MGATVVATKMKEAIEALKLEHRYSVVAKIVTMSFGVTALTPDLELTVETLIKQADLALYQAKEEGRNRVCEYNPESLFKSNSIASEQTNSSKVTSSLV